MCRSRQGMGEYHMAFRDNKPTQCGQYRSGVGKGMAGDLVAGLAAETYDIRTARMFFNENAVLSRY